MNQLTARITVVNIKMRRVLGSVTARCTAGQLFARKIRKASSGIAQMMRWASTSSAGISVTSLK